jgi:alpha-N-arabinofuranosidase
MQYSTRRNFVALGTAGLVSVITPRKGFTAEIVEESIQILPRETIGTVRPELHGQFAEHLGSCVYGGLWVGPASPIPNVNGLRKSAVEYLRALGVPVLRWPGGCFADDYHWRDGIGPIENRPKTVNQHWGMYTEDNAFGMHEFIELCRLIGAQPYFAGNVGSGTPRELRDWMEYCNYPSGSTLSDERIHNGSPDPFRVKYWGIGNELWGCGGNLSGDEYAERYRNFVTFLGKFGDTQPFFIGCGPSKDNAEWTQSFFTGLKGKHLPDGYTMHFYSNSKAPATRFTDDDLEAQFATLPHMEEAILHQRGLMDRFDPQKKVGLMVDEWGVWDKMLPEDEQAHGRLWQQITMRAGVSTALGLNVFHRQADKLVMCNVAQMVNVLDAMLLTEGDKCVRTPAYYAFQLAKPHRGKISVKSSPQANPMALSTSASIRDRSLVLTVVNPKPTQPIRLRANITGNTVRTANATTLFHADMNACNTFSAPDTIIPREITADAHGETITIELPPLSVTTIEAELTA